MLEKWMRVGVLVKCLGLGSLLLGCSAEPAANPGAGGSGGSGGAGGAGGAGAPPKIDATKFIVLSGDSAALSATPAPKAYENCVACHATAGQGITSLAPEIRHSPLTYFNYVTRAGRPGSNMVAFPATMVPDADLAAIHTWLAGLPKPTTGQQLYLDFCGNCHGPDGLGAVVPLAVTGGIKTGTMQLVRMGHGTDPSVRKSYMPAQGPEQLSDAELGMIADFLGAT
jgi:mono/diheme cytochrome c family protein